MKIGFLFNHDQIHQVAHSLPIAIELARRAPYLRLVIATTSDALTREVRRELTQKQHGDVPVVQIGLRRRSTRWAARLLDGAIPFSKLGIYRDNLDFFASFDALVVTEKSSLLLRTRYGLERPRLIHTRHGAGDRAIGFDGTSTLFDHVLVAGPKIRDRLIREAGVLPENLSIVGYPKFDMAKGEPPQLCFSGNGRPTVLYNPHVSPHLSSWYRHGRTVLEHFLTDCRYNLIFAPHVMLFRRRFVVTIDRLTMGMPGRIAEKVMAAPNIHVDLGSRACSDMSYTRTADIYLGDVSSQVYEFLASPRPCIFIDSHATDWRGNPNYAHWSAGEVLTDRDQLGPALDRAIVSHAAYLPAQQELFRSSIALTREPSASRAARAVLALLDPGSPTSAPFREFNHRSLPTRSDQLRNGRRVAVTGLGRRSSRSP